MKSSAQNMYTKRNIPYNNTSLFIVIHKKEILFCVTDTHTHTLGVVGGLCHTSEHVLG
jgi:hypothetical protein